MNKFTEFWKKGSFISELQNIKFINYSGLSSFRLHEMLEWNPPDKKGLIEELKKRGHEKGSKWYKEIFLKKS